jgi:hypothetical protein
MQSQQPNRGMLSYRDALPDMGVEIWQVGTTHSTIGFVLRHLIVSEIGGQVRDGRATVRPGFCWRVGPPHRRSPVLTSM